MSRNSDQNIPKNVLFLENILKIFRSFGGSDPKPRLDRLSRLRLHPRPRVYYSLILWQL